MTDNDHTERAKSAYASDTPPAWEIGRPQRALDALVRRGIESPVLDVGCGTGENALLMAERGHTVVAIDPSELAIAKAKQKAIERTIDITFKLGSGLELGKLNQQFATLIDTGVFHIFNDADRVTYINNLRAALVVGGTYYGICFSDLEPAGWGPRRVTSDEVEQGFNEGWELVALEPSMYETKRGPGKAWLITAKRLA